VVERRYRVYRAPKSEYSLHDSVSRMRRQRPRYEADQPMYLAGIGERPRRHRVDYFDAENSVAELAQAVPRKFVERFLVHGSRLKTGWRVCATPFGRVVRMAL
jgi:hypothetical protein